MPLRCAALIRITAACVALAAPLCAEALSFSNRYRSPRNPERAIRKSTKLIVLHTTEAGAKSSLNKLSERGEAHYCIDEKGVAYRIVDRNREAFHAGRSMWNGKEECDNHSIGIEVVGHHDKPVTLAQLDAIRDLLALLKKEYKIDDAHVVCHSHVAYGAPNKWQKRNHRGRKRCGMLFAMPSVRKKLGLKKKPAFDPDVRAKRLVVGDPYLEKVLYGTIDTMAGKIGRNIAPQPATGFFASLFLKKPSDGEMPSEPEKENYYEKPKLSVAPPQQAKPSVAAPPRPQLVAAPVKAPPRPQLVAAPVKVPPPPKLVAAPPRATGKEPTSLKELQDRMKFKEIGTLGPSASPYKLAGKNWNSVTTYYVVRGQVIRGDKLDPKRIPAGTQVFIRK